MKIQSPITTFIDQRIEQPVDDLLAKAISNSIWWWSYFGIRRTIGTQVNNRGHDIHRQILADFERLI